MTYAVDIDAILRNVPLELKEHPQWVVWRYEDRDGKPTKVPYNPTTGERAKSTDAETWGGFQAALTALASGPSLDGLGFVVSADDPFAGVDLDHVVNDGHVAGWARDICEDLNSYTETSPSGDGLRIIVRAEYGLPSGRRKDQKRGIEMYDAQRFFTITGARHKAYSAEAENRQRALERLHADVFPAEPDIPDAGPPTTPAMDDDEVLKRCRTAANASKFERLFDQGDESWYPSTSEADEALAGILGYWTQDPEQIERLMRQSELIRDKWDNHRTYVQRSIAKTLANRTEENTYSPRVVPRDTRRPLDQEGSEPSLQTAPDDLPVDSLTEAEPPVIDEPRERETESDDDPDAFPVHLLPEALQHWINGAAPIIGCPPGILATFTLGACSAAIGATRKLIIKKTWEELPALWVAVVAEPGSKKTPALKAAMKPLRQRQREYMTAFEREWSSYERQIALWRALPRNEKSERPEPVPPKAQHIIAGDATIESLIAILRDTPRGIVLDQDELVGWISGLNQYKGGKGSDRQHYLSMWSSSEIKVDRKTIPMPIYVTRPFLALVGGIQPEVVDQIQGGKGSDGLFERILWCWPRDMKPQGWSRDDVDDSVEAQYALLMEGLLSREMNTPNGIDPEPAAVRFSDEAEALWGARVGDSERQAFESAEHKNLLSKMPAMAARLILVDHVVRQTMGRDYPDEVRPESVEAGWGLADYFARQGARVLGYAASTASERAADKVYRWVKEHGGTATIRQVVRAGIGIKKASDARAKFGELQDMGLGTMERREVPGGKQISFHVADQVSG